MPRNPKKPAKAGAKRAGPRKRVAEKPAAGENDLLLQADRLLDAKKFDEAIPLLRRVVEREPRNLQASHWLNWALSTVLVATPPEDEAWAEQRRVRDAVLELTQGTRPGGALTLEQRARALALSQRAKARLRRVESRGDLEAALRDGREAIALRDLPDFREVEKLARTAEWLVEAREGKPEEGYGKLVASVRESPGTRARFKPLQPHPDFVGLTAALSDPGFLGWLASKPREARPSDPERAAQLDEALLMAAGKENFARRNSFAQDYEREGRVGRLLTLLHLGADVAARDDYDGCTALHYAAGVGDPAAVAALVKAGAAIDARDKEGNTPLFATCESNRAEAAKVLIGLGADPNAANEDRCSPLFEARDVEVATALLDGGANVGFACANGRTPLHLRALLDNKPLARLLLERGADPAAADEGGHTAADVALAQGHAEMATMLGAGKKKGAIDVQPLLDELEEHADEIRSPAFFEDDDTGRVESILKSVAMKGPASWDELAEACHGENPWNAFAVVDLARRALKPDKKTQSFERPPRFVLGDLVLKGDLNLAGPLLVTGSLTAKGVINDAGPDSLLVVGGDVRARALDTDGEVVVGGNLEVDEVIYGYYNDNSLRVAGNVKARALIEDDHDVQVIGKVLVEHHFDRDRFVSSDRRLKKVFVPEVFDAEGLSRSKLIQRVVARKPVFLKT